MQELLRAFEDPYLAPLLEGSEALVCNLVTFLDDEFNRTDSGSLPPTILRLVVERFAQVVVISDPNQLTLDLAS